MAVIDASVQVALLNEADPHHRAAIEWYRDALIAGEPVASPYLLLAEVAAALSRGLGDSALAHHATTELVAAEQVTLVPVDGPLAERAAQIAVEHGMRGGDAIYAALAAQLGEPLVTLDRDQAARARAVIDVLTPSAS